MVSALTREAGLIAPEAAGRCTGGLWVGSYVKICTHQWLYERGVALAVRQSATEGMEGHRRLLRLKTDA